MRRLAVKMAAFALIGFAGRAVACADDATQTHAPKILLVVGAPGSEVYKATFELWQQRWKDYAEQSASELEIIGSDSDQTMNARDRLSEAIRREADRTQSPLVIVMIGHGTHLRGTSKFNLPGPDITDKELAVSLADVKRPLIIVQCASSSGPFLRTLSRENRVIITATRSQSEQNFSRFGGHFSAALSDPAADLDHDHAISLLEAFLLASHNVADFYRQESRLATEHSLLDDNSDGLGSSATFFRGIRAEKRAKDGASLDGLRAHQFVLLRLPGHAALDPSLVKERDELEERIEALREQKSKLSDDEYFEQLEPLMIELARLYDNSKVD